MITRRAGVGLILLGSIVACTPKGPSKDSGLADDGSTGTESGDGSETGSPTTETGDPDPSETETGTEPDLPPETETGTEPDLPPEPECLPYAEAEAFEQLCFGDPQVFDPSPMNFIDGVWIDANSSRTYVAGPDDHRLYGFSDLLAGGPYDALPFAGTTVELLTYNYDDALTTAQVLVTSQPHAVSFVSFADQVVLSTVALDAEPTAAITLWHGGSNLQTVAVADVDAKLHLFEIDADQLEWTQTLELPEPFERVALLTKVGVPEATQILGLSGESATIWRLSQPFDQTAMLESWTPPIDVVAWRVEHFKDTGNEGLLLFSASPSAMSYQLEFGVDLPNWSTELEFTLHATDWGSEPGDYIASLFGLSKDSARIGKIGDSGGEATSFTAPASWVEVPAGSEDFIAAGSAGFVVVGSAGLVQVPVL